MLVKQNALDHALDYPLTANAVYNSYIDDCLTGADSLDETIKLQRQLQELFARGGFLLCKWNSSVPSVLQHVPAELRDSQCKHAVPDSSKYTKTLGIEWKNHQEHPPKRDRS